MDRKPPIQVRVGKDKFTSLEVDLAACFAFEGDKAPRGVADLRLRSELAARMKAEKFGGRRGDLLFWSTDGRYGPPRFLVVGLGKSGSSQEHALREGCARAARAAEKVSASTLALRLLPAADSPSELQVRVATEGAILGAYRFDGYLTQPARRRLRLGRVVISADGPRREVQRAVRDGETTARAVWFARDLVNEPPSVMTPTEMARRAVTAGRAAGLAIRVLGPTELRKLGMGALLAVGRGSGEPPRVVHLTYRPPRGKPRARVVLVGKGVTFDSGGLNLKQGTAMRTMKCDMAGAAAILAVMIELRRMGCKAEVHGLLGLVENMIGSRSFRPGDILRTFSRKTVEVTDTDAEGRLVLCDLLAYAAGRVKPDSMVDVATLTGACVVALGPLASGVFSRHDPLRESILAAGRLAGEKLWPLPMYDEYLENLQEGPADLRNYGERWGQATEAAVFLGEFVPRDIPWLHLDIAGPAFFERDRPEGPAGGTGAGVPTLIRWLEAI